ncbi:MAG: hypothetical protein PG978_000796 [Wolbachia endosymbiont of Ctenocephalides felis wCfeF]|nr:MAG: hypothetical protein PG978_000796 [Wolbachia endosymbiont of Ctenocephalides felis wCfeF]
MGVDEDVKPIFDYLGDYKEYINKLLGSVDKILEKPYKSPDKI